nr:hypothetical protein [uncultured Desulfobacter sp.]
MRTRYLVLNILVTLFSLCLAQGSSYAWFHSSGNCEECPVFELPRSVENVTQTYAFLPNTPDAVSEIRLYKTSSKNPFPASAGALKIDVPFNLLSASVTNVQAMLDRQVAANLRLKNLLEQYIAQQKKNATMLKDLGIPYLEAKPPPEKAAPASDTEKLTPTDVLRREMAEVMLFQSGAKDRPALRDNHDFQPNSTGKKGRANSVPDLEKYGNSQLKGSNWNNPGRTDTYHQIYGRDTELPWIFSFGLKLLRYLANNKFEILSWAAVMAVIGLVGTIVVKR